MANTARGRSPKLETPLRLIVWGGAGTLLLLPLIAMQFNEEVAWDAADFLVFGAMLAMAGGAVELGARISSSLACRAGFVLAVGATFFLIWANLAIGLIGSEDHPANAMYLAVMAILVFGSAAARLKPAGMVWVMLAAAAAFVAIATVAYSQALLG